MVPGQERSPAMTLDRELQSKCPKERSADKHKHRESGRESQMGTIMGATQTPQDAEKVRSCVLGEIYCLVFIRYSLCTRRTRRSPRKANMAATTGHYINAINRRQGSTRAEANRQLTFTIGEIKKKD